MKEIDIMEELDKLDKDIEEYYKGLDTFRGILVGVIGGLIMWGFLFAILYFCYII